MVFAVLAPVFLVIAIGAVLQRTNFASPDFFKEANRLTYWLGLPALLFSQLLSSLHQVSGASTMLVAMLIATGVVVAVSYALAWTLRVPGKTMGTFVQGCFRGNLAFVGLPIVYSLPDSPVAGGMTLRTAAVLVIAPMMVLYNALGVVVLLLSQHALGWKMLRPLARQLATNPPLIATVIGLLFVMQGWTLPSALDKTFTALGEMALPVGLLSVGASLVTVKFTDGRTPSIACAVVKTIVSPAVAYLVGHAMGLNGLELKVVAILMATPTAIISYTVAREMKGDEALASGAIVTSVLASVAALAVIVGLPA